MQAPSASAAISVIGDSSSGQQGESGILWQEVLTLSPGRQCYSLPARKKWVHLVPAATVIPAPLAYIKVVAVNNL